MSDPDLAAFLRSRGQAPPNAEALVALRKSIRRRMLLGVTGVGIAIVGTQIDAAALGLPGFVPVLVGIAGAMVAAFGALGMRRGVGCLSSVLALVWLSSWACALASPGSLQILAGAVVTFSLLSIFTSRRKKPQVRDRPGPQAGVIDVDGHEVEPPGPAELGPVIDVESEPRE